MQCESREAAEWGIVSYLVYFQVASMSHKHIIYYQESAINKIYSNIWNKQIYKHFRAPQYGWHIYLRDIQ